MRNVGGHRGGAMRLECTRRVAERAGRVHHVVDHDAVLALDLADDVHDFGLIRPGTPFVDDDEVGIVQSLGECAGTDYAADVRRNNHHVVILLLPDVTEQDWGRINVVHGNVEKALDLVGVQIDSQDAVDTCGTDQLGHELCGDGNAREPRPSILASKAEIRNDCGNSCGGRTSCSVNHHQQFHQVFGRRGASGLDNEDFAAANVLQDLHVDFAVAEAAYLSLGDRYS